MHFEILNNTGIDMSNLIELAQELLPFSQEKVGWKRPPTLRLDSDPENGENPLGKTAHYNPKTLEITILVDKRHPKDILRSLSHELVHHFQNEIGDFDKEFETGPGYAQADPHLREMEREAYEVGNLCFRDWEDGKKKNLSESTYYTKPILLGGEEMSNKTPVKDWKNEEMNYRLMKKFGLVKEEISVDGGAEQVYHEDTTAEKRNSDEDDDEDEGSDDEDADSTKLPLKEGWQPFLVEAETILTEQIGHTPPGVPCPPGTIPVGSSSPTVPGGGGFMCAPSGPSSPAGPTSAPTPRVASAPRRSEEDTFKVLMYQSEMPVDTTRGRRECWYEDEEKKCINVGPSERGGSPTEANPFVIDIPKKYQTCFADESEGGCREEMLDTGVLSYFEEAKASHINQIVQEEMQKLIQEQHSTAFPVDKKDTSPGFFDFLSDAWSQGTLSPEPSSRRAALARADIKDKEGNVVQPAGFTSRKPYQIHGREHQVLEPDYVAVNIPETELEYTTEMSRQDAEEIFGEAAPMYFRGNPDGDTVRSHYKDTLPATTMYYPKGREPTTTSEAQDWHRAQTLYNAAGKSRPSRIGCSNKPGQPKCAPLADGPREWIVPPEDIGTYERMHTSFQEDPSHLVALGLMPSGGSFGALGAGIGKLPGTLAGSRAADEAALAAKTAMAAKVAPTLGPGTRIASAAEKAKMLDVATDAEKAFFAREKALELAPKPGFIARLKNALSPASGEMKRAVEAEKVLARAEQISHYERTAGQTLSETERIIQFGLEPGQTIAQAEKIIGRTFTPAELKNLETLGGASGPGRVSRAWQTTKDLAGDVRQVIAPRASAATTTGEELRFMEKFLSRKYYTEKEIAALTKIIPRGEETLAAFKNWRNAQLFKHPGLRPLIEYPWIRTLIWGTIATGTGKAAYDYWSSTPDIVHDPREDAPTMVPRIIDPATGQVYAYLMPKDLQKQFDAAPGEQQQAILPQNPNDVADMFSDIGNLMYVVTDRQKRAQKLIDDLVYETETKVNVYGAEAKEPKRFWSDLDFEEQNIVLGYLRAYRAPRYVEQTMGRTSPGHKFFWKSGEKELTKDVSIKDEEGKIFSTGEEPLLDKDGKPITITLPSFEIKGNISEEKKQAIAAWLMIYGHIPSGADIEKSSADELISGALRQHFEPETIADERRPVIVVPEALRARMPKHALPWYSWPMFVATRVSTYAGEGLGFDFDPYKKLETDVESDPQMGGPFHPPGRWETEARTAERPFEPYTPEEQTQTPAGKGYEEYYDPETGQLRDEIRDSISRQAWEAILREEGISQEEFDRIERTERGDRIWQRVEELEDGILGAIDEQFHGGDTAEDALYEAGEQLGYTKKQVDALDADSPQFDAITARANEIYKEGIRAGRFSGTGGNPFEPALEGEYEGEPARGPDIDIPPLDSGWHNLSNEEKGEILLQQETGVTDERAQRRRGRVKRPRRQRQRQQRRRETQTPRMFRRGNPNVPKRDDYPFSFKE